MNIPRMNPTGAGEEARFVAGGPCYICKKPLITSLAAAPLMTKPNARTTREERLQRDFVTKFLNKDIPSRTIAEMADINRFIPLEDKEQVVAVSCGHLFHRSCFREYSEKYKSVKKCGLAECPLCRKYALLATTVNVDLRPIDCGHDKLPLPYGKEIKAKEKEGVAMRDHCIQARLNYSRGFRFYLEQMFKFKNFKREVLEYYKPYWTNKKNVDLLRERRANLTNEAKGRDEENVDKAASFLTKLEKDERLPLVAILSLRKIRQSRDGLETFRSLVKSLYKRHIDPTTGDINLPQFNAHLLQILCKGFYFP